MHGLVMTAYQDFPQLAHSVAAAIQDSFVYLHVDTKTSFSKAEWSWLRSQPNLTVSSRYDVPWGGFSHLRAVIDGLEGILQNRSIETVHIVSGQDYPVQPITQYARFRDPLFAYLSVTRVTDQPVLLARFQTRLHRVDSDLRDPEVRGADAASTARQRTLGQLRSTLGGYGEIYKGMIWSSLPRDMGEYVVQAARTDNDFMNDLRTTRIPEEFFLQTVLMNSPYRDRISTDLVHYMDWRSPKRGAPAFLDESDFQKILHSRKFFARKFSTEHSDKLRRLLATHFGFSHADLSWRSS